MSTDPHSARRKQPTSRRRWLLALSSLCLGSALATVARARPTAALDATLADQFDRPHRLKSFFGNRRVVIVAGDRKETRDEMKRWVTALAPRLSGKATLLGLAELDGVPFFIPNSTVKNKLKELFPKLVVLCDWDDEVYERIGFADDTLVAVGVFAQTGERLRVVTGKLEKATLARVLDALRSK